LVEKKGNIIFIITPFFVKGHFSRHPNKYELICFLVVARMLRWDLTVVDYRNIFVSNLRSNYDLAIGFGVGLERLIKSGFSGDIVLYKTGQDYWIQNRNTSLTLREFYRTGCWPRFDLSEARLVSNAPLQNIFYNFVIKIGKNL